MTRRSSGSGTPLADHRGHLQHVLLTLVETIDARGEDRLHRRRNSEAFDGPCQLIGAAPPGKRAGLDQGLHHLLDEIRVAARAGVDQLRQRRDACVAAEQLADRLGPER